MICLLLIGRRIMPQEKSQHAQAVRPVLSPHLRRVGSKQKVIIDTGGFVQTDPTVWCAEVLEAQDTDVSRLEVSVQFCFVKNACNSRNINNVNINTIKYRLYRLY